MWTNELIEHSSVSGINLTIKFDNKDGKNVNLIIETHVYLLNKLLPPEYIHDENIDVNSVSERRTARRCRIWIPTTGTNDAAIKIVNKESMRYDHDTGITTIKTEYVDITPPDKNILYEFVMKRVFRMPEYTIHQLSKTLLAIYANQQNAAFKNLNDVKLLWFSLKPSPKRPDVLVGWMPMWIPTLAQFCMLRKAIGAIAEKDVNEKHKFQPSKTECKIIDDVIDNAKDMMETFENVAA